MKEDIRSLDPSSEYRIDEGCYITEVSNSHADPELSIARARVEPGRTTRWHRLDGTVERYVITAGNGRVEVADLPPSDVGPGDVVLIPPGQRQRITNTGDADLIWLAIVVGVLFLIPGVVYGYRAGTVNSSRDIITGMSKAMESMAYYLVIMFFIAQFIFFMSFGLNQWLQ